MSNKILIGWQMLWVFFLGGATQGFSNTSYFFSFSYYSLYAASILSAAWHFPSYQLFFRARRNARNTLIHCSRVSVYDYRFSISLNPLSDVSSCRLNFPTIGQKIPPCTDWNWSRQTWFSSPGRGSDCKSALKLK